VTPPIVVVSLVDLDDTLLDNERLALELKRHLERPLGPERQERYPAKELAAYPRSDLSIDRIGDLLKLDLDSLLEAGRGEDRSYER